MPDAAALDRANPLARFRTEFHLPAGRIYLDGNSLGLLSRRAEACVLRVLDQWRTLGIEGWTEAAPPWLTLAEDAAEKIAPLLGASADEVCITGQTTANLHQLLATLFDPTGRGWNAPSAQLRPSPANASAPSPPRRVLLGDALNFASDTYALHSHLRLRGLNPAAYLRLIPSRDGRILRLDDILDAFTDDVQLAVLPAVVFTSGQLLDVATLTRKAHERGILIGLDCSHSIGAVPHAFDRDGVDFAFWCNYKWLNAGPGAVGGLYLNRNYHALPPGLAGWWGVRPHRRFAMAPRHEPAPGARALHIGTPHLLSLAPLLGSLDLIEEAGGVTALRETSLALTDFLQARLQEELDGLGFTIVTPHGHPARGGHIALAHPDAWRICQALKADGVLPDFRAPDLIRLAPSPLYTRFADCAEAAARLGAIVRAGRHHQFSHAPQLVP